MTMPRAAGYGWFIGLFVFLLLSPVNAHAADIAFPNLTGRVIDQANIMSRAARSGLSGELAAHEERTTNQIVVVTLKSLQGRTIEEYGYQLGRHWGIGQKEKNNGVLLIVVPTERKVRIEVGYGLEGKLTDAVSRLIIEQVIVPEFRAGRMRDGIVAGTRRIISVLEGETAPGRPSSRSGSDVDWEHQIAVFVILLMVVFFIFGDLIFRSHPKRQKCCSDKAKKAAATPATKAECRYHDDHFGGYGGGFGSGGFGGGGGGFSGGGGSFGGGGSSGGW